MFTAYRRKGTWNIKSIFPALLVLLCFEEIYSSLSNASSIDEACFNGTQITLTWTNSSPYVFEKNGRAQGILVDILEKGISICCKVGTQINYQYTNMNDSNFKNQSIDHPHIPISILSYKKRTSFGQPIVGLVDSPGIAVITQATVPGADLLMAILDSWPILIFIITTISLSGVMIWLLDYKKNSAHFPAFFPMGVFEGCWWAAVTMTTVGYGDRVPKSVGGRLFAVVWINAGLVILAMFMGIVTASLTSSSWTDINHFWGIEVAVINRSAEYQFAILQSANVKAQDFYEDMYSSVASGISKVALVDEYTATCHSDFFYRHKLTIATIIDVPVVNGILFPSQGTQTINQCLYSYVQSYKVSSYSYITKHLTQHPVSDISDGTEYFRESMFGYSVYAMTGLFLLILGTGILWQHYWQPRHGEWNQNTAMKELEMTSVSQIKGYPRVNYVAHVQTTRLGEPRPHCSRTQQCMGIRQLLDEYREYEKSWTKRFIYLQEKHRREQVEVFNLDNDGYNM